MYLYSLCARSLLPKGILNSTPTLLGEGNPLMQDGSKGLDRLCQQLTLTQHLVTNLLSGVSRTIRTVDEYSKDRRQ